ncbi:MAG: InlB B-repeat-containing protein [Clostridia bacterium]|nr:InlB B-repeat-containing protein [Clostridia bacterium]
MKKFSKVLAVLLAMLMMLSIVPITAFAADTYSVKYHANGGKGTMSNTSFNVDEAKALRANSFTKTGYSFLGWAKDQTATVPEYYNQQTVTNLGEAGQTVTLYAVWKANTYVIEFQANGGEGSMENQTHTYGESLALSASTFTKTGYSFIGWAKTKNATTALYDDQEAVKNLTPYDGTTVVLYAVWKKDPVTVKRFFIETEPTKKEYFVGDALDTTGLVVKADLSDNTVKTVTDYTVSAPDMTTTGEKTVTVSYEGFEVTFTITVAERPTYNYTFSIVAPEVVEVANGDSVVLSAKVEGTYPEGMYVKWTANNNNFAATANADGTYTVVAEGVGATTFTATLYTAENEAVAEDTVELTALEKVEEPEEPGFFEKIINFFKGIIAKIVGIFQK